MVLEICASTYQSAINAQQGGAHRIELCEDLSVGGITPSYHLIKKVVNHLSIPVFVLIRPRAGNFVYSEEEFNQMKADIKFCKSIGCKGIVSGVLNSENNIDLQKTKALIKLSHPLPFTFHRAFDEIPDYKRALHQLIDLGCTRVLTSGQANTALEGLSLLKVFKKLVDKQLVIVVGGHIRSENAVHFKTTGFNEIHSSAIVNTVDSDVNEIKQLAEITRA